jgi:hypothetical protein
MTRRGAATTSWERAENAVASFHACKAFEPSNGRVRAIEVVWISQASRGGNDLTAGIRLTWTQGPWSFGLLMPIDRLIEQSGDAESVGFYLRLAVDEPHGPTPNAAAAWFTDLPSGPYEP